VFGHCWHEGVYKACGLRMGPVDSLSVVVVACSCSHGGNGYE